MKPFQTLLFLAVLILIGGIAALYWGKSIQETTAPVVVDEQVETIIEPTRKMLESGEYLVFQVDDWFFYRLAVDEIGESEPFEFAVVKNPLAVSGGLTAYVYGQDLLLHRYLEEEQDGILGLDGKVSETRPIQWGTLRSANGRYEVVWESVYDRVETDVVVTDLETGQMLATIPQAAFETAEPVFDAEPFLLDDEGRYLYVHEVCACEAVASGIWQVEIATGEVTQLDELVDLDSWFLSSLDAQSRRLLTISTDRQQSEDGPYDELLPPTTIRLLNLDTLESRELLVDKTRAWDRPMLDPEGNDRYVVRLWSEEDVVTLVNFDDAGITQEQVVSSTDAWILDWVGDWVVVQNNQDSTLKLVNVETKEEVTLEIPGERVEYVGSIELE